MINVDITTSLSSETNRLIAVYKNVLNGFYLKNGFYPLPYANINNKVETVILPKMQINSELISKINNLHNINDVDFDYLGSAILKQFNFNIDNLGCLINDKNYISNVQKYLNESWIKLSRSFYYLKNKNIKVNVYLTKYGTLGSFNGANVDSATIEVKLYLREDMDPSYICELLVSSLTYNLVHKYSTPWQNAEAVSDFLTMHFINVPNFTPTLKATEKINNNLLSSSVKFLHKIGLPANSILNTDESLHKIYLRNIDITSIFSQYEQRVLFHLVSNKNNVITFDDIAKVLYGEKAEINFSLWGINKCIQRIRVKLEDQGLPKSIIKNVKGVGFVY